MNSLNKINENFGHMLITKKVDLSIISDLNQAKKDLNQFKIKKLNKIHLAENFPLFHAIETQNRVLDQMIYRVDNAAKRMDNPKVAKDALIVIPHLKGIYNSLKEETKEDSHYLMSLSSKLQIVAMKSGMYPSQTEITKEINKKFLENNFNKFADKIGEEIV